MNILLLVLLGISLLYEQYTQALVVGSANAVSLVTTCTIFPAKDQNNTIYGFAWLKGGYKLEDQTTSCTFYGVYPISGTVDLSGGTLFLLQDMVFANPTQLNGLGTIIGNNHLIEFCESITSMPANLNLIKNLQLFLNRDTVFQGNLEVQGNCLINAGGNRITFGNNAVVTIDANSGLEIQDAFLTNVSNNIMCLADTSNLVFRDVTASFTGDSHFTQGALIIKNNVSFTGRYTYWYDSTKPCWIGYSATLSLDGGLTFKCGNQTVGESSPVQFYNNNSILKCGECSLLITSTGISLTSGRIEVQKNLTIESASTDTTHGIIIGDGISASNDLTICLDGGSHVTFAAPVVYQDILPNRFYSAGPNTSIERQINNTFYLATNCIYPKSNAYIDVSGTQFAQTILANGVTLFYNKVNVKIPGLNEVTYYAMRTDEYSCLLNGGQYIYLTSGSFIDPLWTSSQENLIAGNGDIEGAITLLDSNTELLLNLNGSLYGTTSLNGGIIRLYNDISISSQNCFSTPGIIDLQDYSLKFDYSENILTTENQFECPMTWSGSNGFISINNNTTLSTTWTINGHVTIDGNGHTLNLDNDGMLVIAPNAYLTLRNIRLNLDLGNIICVDDSSVLTLDAAHWIQHGDFTFTAGSLIFKNAVKMSGLGLVFTYQSTQTSTIDYDASLELDYNFTFSYAPSNNAETLLQLQDISSRLSLYYSTLYIQPGLSLLKGQLIVSGNATIYALGDGLTLGDQTSADDIQFIFNGAPTLTIQQGTFTYKNTNSQSLQMNRSQINLMNNVLINVYENMDLNGGLIEFFPTATYAHFSDTAIQGSVIGAYLEIILSDTSS